MNIVVLGGGTAGWLTALLAREFYQHHNVTVIESEEIGILGAGEGTVPHFISVLDTINIPVTDLLRECDATIKTGIRFDNWNGTGESYFHPFHGQAGLSLSSCDTGTHFVNLLQTKEIAMGQQLTSFAEIMSKECRVPFSYANAIDRQFDNPILRLNNHNNFALHFNARHLAVFLRKVALSRRIRRIEGKLKQVVNNEQGNISQLVLENGITVDVDFVFDCSGFARLLIGKHYNTPWQSYSRHLPMKAARPFFIPHSGGKIRPDTGSIAMKYGWIWQIPTQERYGCGYVFDSDYINDEQALAEVEEYLGHPVESPAKFKFDAGMYQDSLVKNCLAVGLAQSFIEPLEATSILISSMNLLQFLKNNGIFSRSDQFRKMYNEKCRERNQEVLEFVYLHYITKRNDSEFWREFSHKTEIPEGLKNKLELWNDVAPGEYLDPASVFSLGSWLHVAQGVGQLNPIAFAHRMVELSIDQRMQYQYQKYLSNLQTVAKGCMDHWEFINFLKSN